MSDTTCKIKCNGRNVREMADEVAKIVGKSVHFNLYGYTLFFGLEDAAQLKLTLEDAANLLRRLGKRAKSQAAETLRSQVAEVIISESARLSWSK